MTALEEAVAYIVATYGQDIEAASVGLGALPQAHWASLPAAGRWPACRARLRPSAWRGSGDADFYKAKITTARFYADHVLSQAPGLAYSVVNGAAAAPAGPARRDVLTFAVPDRLSQEKKGPARLLFYVNAARESAVATATPRRAG